MFLRDVIEAVTLISEFRFAEVTGRLEAGLAIMMS